MRNFQKIYKFYIPRNQLGLAINSFSQEILPRCKYILPRNAPISGIGSEASGVNFLDFAIQVRLINARDEDENNII